MPKGSKDFQDAVADQGAARICCQRSNVHAFHTIKPPASSLNHLRLSPSTHTFSTANLGYWSRGCNHPAVKPRKAADETIAEANLLQLSN